MLIIWDLFLLLTAEALKEPFLGYTGLTRVSAGLPSRHSRMGSWSRGPVCIPRRWREVVSLRCAARGAELCSEAPLFPMFFPIHVLRPENRLDLGDDCWRRS